METNGYYWRLAQHCGRWASENQHSNIRNAFLAMANVWAQLALQKETGDHRRVVFAIGEKAQTAVLGLSGVSEQRRFRYVR